MKRGAHTELLTVGSFHMRLTFNIRNLKQDERKTVSSNTKKCFVPSELGGRRRRGKNLWRVKKKASSCIIKSLGSFICSQLSTRGYVVTFFILEIFVLYEFIV